METLKKTPISAIILTKNEEDGIKRCIDSLLWCDEIIVVDDYSDDQTIAQAKRETVTIYKRKLGNDFSAQRNFALSKARHPWIFFVDADEVVPDALRLEIQEKLTSNSSYSGFTLSRRDFLFGRWLLYGETAAVRFLRLAKKTAGKWHGHVHEVWEIKGKIGVLENPLHHFPHETVSFFLAHINRYTDLLVEEWKEEGKRVTFLDIILYPKAKFFLNFILRGGFRDGMPGLVLALLMSFHSFLARAKYYLATKKR